MNARVKRRFVPTEAPPTNVCIHQRPRPHSGGTCVSRHSRRGSGKRDGTTATSDATQGLELRVSMEEPELPLKSLRCWNSHIVAE